jgi:hypothetical protein
VPIPGAVCAEPRLVHVGRHGRYTSAFTLLFLDVLREPPRDDYEDLSSPVPHSVTTSPYHREKPNYIPQCGWATVSCDVLLNCGPLRVPKWRFAIIRGEMQEGILDRDFVKEVLGLDLKKIFEDAHTRAASNVVDTSDSIEFVSKTELSWVSTITITTTTHLNLIG